MLNASRYRSATKVLQEIPIRPQSNNVRKGNLRGASLRGRCPEPGTVTFEEEEEPGAMAIDGSETGQAFAAADPDQCGESEEEARMPKTKKAPVGMTPAEWQVHRLTHLPYNAACRCCVAGRKRDDQHRRRKEGPLQAQADLDAAGGESIYADYFFPKDAPGKEGVTAVALCDRQTGWLAGHVVSSKGSGTRAAVEQILRDLRRMGHHGKIVVKTDQESAIMDLLRTVAKERGEARTVFETAARSDSKGNGEAEKAVQSIEEMVRTLMVDLEERCGETLSVTEPFFEWLVEHACDVLNKYHVRKGKKTAWEAIKKGTLRRGRVPIRCPSHAPALRTRPGWCGP